MTSLMMVETEDNRFVLIIRAVYGLVI